MDHTHLVDGTNPDIHLRTPPLKNCNFKDIEDECANVNKHKQEDFSGTQNLLQTEWTSIQSDIEKDVAEIKISKQETKGDVSHKAEIIIRQFKQS
jgi:hypothetical protein